MWATCNIGASKPEEYGDYFAWGETVPYGQEDRSNVHNYATTGSYTKTKFLWGTYKYCRGTENNTLTKYCYISNYGNNGFTDTLTELTTSDDAAYVNWGSQWRMPSVDQFEELINSSYTTTSWTTQKGVYGRLITSNSNGNSLFLPATGYREVSSLTSADDCGHYWSRMLLTNDKDTDRAYYLNIFQYYVITYNGSRYFGRSVRPVRNADGN